MTREQLDAIGKRFNEIRPDYSISFGEQNYVNEEFMLVDFTVNKTTGRVTMQIQEVYLKSNYALGYRTHVRHPRLIKDEIDYLLGGGYSCVITKFENSIAKETVTLKPCVTIKDAQKVARKEAKKLLDENPDFKPIKNLLLHQYVCAIENEDGSIKYAFSVPLVKENKC